VFVSSSCGIDRTSLFKPDGPKREQKEQAVERKETLCVTLDKAGVPTDSKWRSLILYIRDLKEHDYLSDRQKAQIHELLKKLINEHEYTEESFQELVKEKEQILSAPYIMKLQETIQESQKLIDDFQQLMQKRRGDIKNLEVSTIGGIESGKDPQDMIKNVREAFHDVINVMEEDVSKLDQLSKTDGLTGLYNRRALDEYLERRGEIFKHEDKPHSFMMLDIDHFKKFNDNYGHRIGDQALATVSKIIREAIDEFSDRQGGEHFGARYGGEEFAVVMCDTTVKNAVLKAEAIRERIENYNFIIRDAKGAITHKGIKITASIGVAEMKPEWGSTLIESLVNAADQALYVAKSQGRNRVCQDSDNL
jgi:diguanylate cyclase (GGDEF)-like protein